MPGCEKNQAVPPTSPPWYASTPTCPPSDRDGAPTGVEEGVLLRSADLQAIELAAEPLGDRPHQVEHGLVAVGDDADVLPLLQEVRDDVRAHVGLARAGRALDAEGRPLQGPDDAGGPLDDVLARPEQRPFLAAS